MELITRRPQKSFVTAFISAVLVLNVGIVGIVACIVVATAVLLILLTIIVT